MKYITLICLILFNSVYSNNVKDKLLVVNKDEGTVWIINTADYEVEHKINVGDGPHEIAVSPDGKTAVAGNYFFNGKPYNTLKVIDVEKGLIIKSIDISPYYTPHGITFLNETEIYVTVENHKKILKVNIESGEILEVINTEGGIHLVEFDKNKKIIYGTSIGGGNLNIIESDNIENVKTVYTGKGTEALAVRPNSNEIWVGNNDEHNIKIIDSEKKEIVKKFNCGIMPIRISFTKDGKYAIVSRYIIGDVAVYNADSKELLKTIEFGFYLADENKFLNSREEEQNAIVDNVVKEGARPLGSIIDKDNKYLFVSLRGVNKIAVIDIKSWEVIKTIESGKGPDGLAISRIN